VPKVSVIIATYHRPAVLRQTLLSVERQTESDWEVIVVGDACTDATEATVAAFRDRRIRFHNLPVNCGDQSGPNNAGIDLAVSNRLAFLNHDDLWFPDHLERSLTALDAGRADLVFCLGASMRMDGGAEVLSASPGDVYDPCVDVPASCWVFERSLAARVGPWRRSRDIFNVPSQDWLFRAHRIGARMLFAGHLGLVAVQSGYRPGCYLEAGASEQESLAVEMLQPGWREQLVTRCLSETAARWQGARVRRHIAAAMVAGLGWVAARLGVHPASLRHALRFRKRGGKIKELRRTRGLPNLTP
jgi:hypothetical protein